MRYARRVERVWLALLCLTGCTFGSGQTGSTGAGSTGEASTGSSPVTGPAATGADDSSGTTSSVVATGEGSGGSTGVSTGSMDATDSTGSTGSTGVSTDSTTAGSETTGGAPELFANCAEILAADDQAMDGVYTVDVDGEGRGLEPFDVYCDMTTEDGGWTLVFAYGFTSYDPFVSSGNAVSVRPNWPVNVTQSVPVSTTPPLSLDEEGAVDFALWPDLGSSFIVLSNINNGIMCDELTGSLVTGTPGTLDCTLIEDVTGTCTDVVPGALVQPNYGYSLNAPMFYYYWDGDTSTNWPTHDPCGMNAPNQLTGVADPFGAILVRP